MVLVMDKSILKVILKVKLLTDTENDYFNMKNLKLIWSNLLSLDLENYTILLSNFYSVDNRFNLRKLKNENSYKISLVFEDEAIKGHLAKNILNSQKDTFESGPYKFILEDISLKYFLKDHNQPNTIIFDSLDSGWSAYINLKTPLLLDDKENSIIVNTNELSVKTIAELLSARMEKFGIQLEKYLHNIEEIRDLRLDINSYHLKGTEVGSNFGIIGWLKITMTEHFEELRKLLYLLDFFGLGSGGENGYGFIDVNGLI